MILCCLPSASQAPRTPHLSSPTRVSNLQQLLTKLVISSSRKNVYKDFRPRCLCLLPDWPLLHSCPAGSSLGP